jgi:4-amino-4-deoxy-L-arabinose transferase-like glycosyltransferase
VTDQNPPAVARPWRKWYAAIVAAVGLLLFVPGLNGFGLWDPYEIRIADAARMVATTHTWSLLPQLSKPPALIWLVAFGFDRFGVHEGGGRLPIAILAALVLVATYYAGAGLGRRRAAFLGTLALATCPAFLLGARQLTSNVPLYLGAVLAVGGIGRAVWPPANTSEGRRLLDLLLGVAGLIIGFLSGGLLIGVLPTLAAVAIAVPLVGGATSVATIAAVSSLGVLALVLAAFRHTGYTMLLGGVPHAFASTAVITTHLKALGFAAFPWVALAPLAALRALTLVESAPAAATTDAKNVVETDAGRERFGALFLLAWIVVLYVAGTFQSAGVVELSLPLLPMVLLLIGGYLDDVLSQVEPLPFAGLVAALGALILGRDFFLFPESYVGAHITESIRWPGPLTNVPYVIMAYAAFWAGVVGLGLGVRLAHKDADAATHQKGRRLLIGGALGASMLMALATAWWIVPQVSKHLSVRDVYGKTAKLDPKAPIGQYRFNASGAAYYHGDKPATTLMSVKDVFDFLAKPERVFVMAGSEELPSIDQTSRQDKKSYFVVDDTNSRFLVLSNRLGPNEQDVNPLKRFISDQPPKPQHVVEAEFEGKVKLLGYDLLDSLSRGQDFKIRLYFQVLQPLGGGYKVFIHFDGPGSRFNGDHVPLEGRFPTNHWVPGYYITDEHAMTPDRATQPAGYYKLFMGFFSGDTRLKVTNGPQDGENRVKLGGITIK